MIDPSCKAFTYLVRGGAHVKHHAVPKSNHKSCIHVSTVVRYVSTTTRTTTLFPWICFGNDQQCNPPKALEWGQMEGGELVEDINVHA